MTASGEMRAEATSDKGMGVLRPDEFEPALLDLIDPWLGSGPMEITACGMVGSRQGWAEAPYASAPCKPLDLVPVMAPTKDRRLNLRLIPGIKQENPADVMRGEETQIAGFLSARPGFDGVLCLPGTHTKWVEISAGEVVSFRTFMTGELFALLSRQSVLRHSTGDGWNDDAFAEAVDEAMSRPEMLAARLFSIRAEGLLKGPDPASATARLSGLLVGAELAAARPYWLGREISVIGADFPARVYADALGLQGLEAPVSDGARMTRAGLSALHQRHAESVT
jgi:2-dehydro-3-deoxygalactonokinase